MAAGIPFCAASVTQRAISFHSAANKDPALTNTICLRSSSRRFSSIRSSIQLTLHLDSGKDEKLGSNPAHLFSWKAYLWKLPSEAEQRWLRRKKRMEGDIHYRDVIP